MARKRSRWSIILGSIAILFIILALLGFLCKGLVLDKAIAKIQAKLKSKYDLTLTFRSYRLNGWSDVEMDGIYCQTAAKDTLAYFNKVDVQIRILPLFTGRLRLKDVLADNGIIDIDRLRQLKNQHAEDTSGHEGDTTRLGKVKRYIGYLKEAAAVMPAHLLVHNVRLRFHDSAEHIHALIDSMAYADSRLHFSAFIDAGYQRQQWLADGTFDKNDLSANLHLSTPDESFYVFNFIRKRIKSDIKIKNVRIRLDRLEDEDKQVAVEGALYADNVKFFNQRLSSDTIVCDSGGIAYSARMTAEQIVLDSSSSFSLNGLTANFGAVYKYNTPKTIAFNIHMPRIPAQKLINAMPAGTFDQTKGMALEGELAYDLNFYLDITNKDTAHIGSDMHGYNVHVVRYGNAILSKLNGTFTYYPYNSKRPIVVGPENPDYTPLASMPKQLTDAVVSSEDPTFYYHHGFVPYALEESLLRDLRKGAFRQGGSTIPMQLVKNVFLTHKKTLDRKLEEFFLVWLMDNQHIVSKGRMLEVYLNIIEWGPNVYGIGEASRFFFNKIPSELNLNECIFLAKIVPQPLGFMYRFDENGKLKENFQRKVQGAVNRLSRWGKLDEEDQATFWPEVQITGPAKQYIKIKPAGTDSLRIKDSLEQMNDW